MRSSKFALKLAGVGLLVASVLAPIARADISVTVGENKTKAREQSGKSNLMSWLFKQGTGGPGHTVVFVSDFCLQSKDGKPDLFAVRMCDDSDQGEKGVFLSFIAGLSGGHAWIAMPPSLYLYGTLEAKNKPLFTTSFDRDFYNAKEKSGERPLGMRSDKLDTTTTNGIRYSALDLVRDTILPEMNGNAQAGDKVNIFVTPERDVYSMTIAGDTKAEAQKLLAYLGNVKNLSKPTTEGEKVQGTFGWWHNCTNVANEWMNVMFDKELNVNGNLFELEMNNPQNYSRGMVGKMKDYIKRYNAKAENKAHPRAFVISYYPKITSDRPASDGFGSPTQNLYDPRTIGGAFMVKGQLWKLALGGHPEIAAIFFLGRIKNFLFHMNKPYHELADIGFSPEDVAAEPTKGDIDAAKKRIKELKDQFFGTDNDWKSAKAMRVQLFTSISQNEKLPEELRYLVSSNANQKIGHFAYDVAGVMALRSQALLKGDELGFNFYFKKMIDDPKHQGLKIQDADEGEAYTTMTSEDGLRDSHNALSAMLALAVIDDFLGQKEENRPSWPEMKRFLDVGQAAVEGATASTHAASSKNSSRTTASVLATLIGH